MVSKQKLKKKTEIEAIEKLIKIIEGSSTKIDTKSLKSLNKIIKSIKEEDISDKSLLEMIAYHTGQLLYDYDISSGKIKWYGNISLLKTTSKNLSRFNLKKWEENIHPDDKKYVLSKLDKSIKKNEPYFVEYRFKNKNGEYYYCRDSGGFITNEKGKVVRMIGSMSDISNEKIKTESLKSSYEIQKSIFELSEGLKLADTFEKIFKTSFYFIKKILNADRASILLKDSQGIMRFKAWDNLSEEYRNKVEGHSPWHPDEKNPQPFLIENVKKDKSLKKLKEYILKEKIQSLGFYPLYFEGELIGKLMVYFSSPQKFQESDIIFTQSIANQIAFAIGKKIAEQKIIDAEVKYRTVVDHLNEGIVIHQKGKIVFINKYAIKLMGGKQSEDFIGTDVLNYVHPDYRKQVLDRINKSISTNTPTDLLQEKFITLNGKVIDVEVMSIPIIYNGESASQVIFNDITEKKRNQAELEKSYQLSNMLMMFSKEFINIPLNKYDEKINQTLKTIGEYLGVDRVYIFDYNFNKETARNTFEWCAEGISAEIENLQNVPLSIMAELVDTHLKGKLYLIPDVDKLPHDSEFYKILFEQQIKTLITQPLMDGDNCIGFIGFDSVRKIKNWNDLEKNLLFILAEIISNVSIKKRNEETIKESEELFRTLAESTTTGICIYQNENIIYTNPAAQLITGFSKEELLQKKFWELVPQELHEKIRERGFARQRGEEIENIIEFPIINKEGKEKWVNFSAGVVNWKGKPTVVGSAIDITDSKKAKEEIIERERNYREIFNSTDDAILIIDPDTLKIIDVNDTLLYLFGLDNKNEVLNSDLYSLNYLKDAFGSEILGEYLKNAGKDPQLCQCSAKKKDESRIFVEVVIKLTSIAGEKRILVLMRDISHRKTAEIIHKLQYSIANSVVTSKSLLELFTNVRNELSTLIDAKNMFIAFYDKETDMLTSPFEWDEKADAPETWSAKKSLTGLVVKNKKTFLISKEEMIRMTEDGVINQIGSRPEVWLGVPLRIGENVTGAIVVQSYDNPKAYNQQSVEILEIIANQLSIYIEEKKYEERIKLLSHSLEESPVCIIITDAKGRIEYVNKNFIQITGYSFEEVRGKSPEILKSGYHPKEFFTSMWKDILEGKDWHGEVLNKKKNGELYWEEVLISPVHNDDGEVVNFVSLQVDITEKKKMIEELITAKEKAEEMNRVKSNFFANMSHELRTPLIGILGFSEILKDELIDNQEHKRMVEVINRAGNRLLETLNLILNFSKLEENKQEVIKKDVNIIPVIEETFKIFTSTAALKNLNYSFVCDEKEIVCNIDPNLLHSILSNLINNAMKFTAQGYITVTALKDENTAVISVSDSGIGIEKEKLNLIWEEFRQVSEGLGRQFEGTGLGLALVKKYTELLGGNIKVTSAPGEGTTFKLLLPLANIFFEKDEVDVNSEAERIYSFINKNYKLLYVEDDPDAADLVGKVLSPYFFIDYVSDAESGEQIIEKQNYDAVLIDINLKKGIDGLEFARRIRNKPNYEDKPLIAITAFAMDEDKNEFLSKGMSHYISKPFKNRELLNLLDSVFSNIE